MKKGKTLVELATEIERQSETKRDFIVDTRVVTMDDKARLNVKGIEDIHDMSLNHLAHRQIAERVKIPFNYYERMKETSPALLAENVNHWFESTPEKRMVRTLDGNVRAFLSNGYRPLDNWDLCQAELPIIQQLGCEIVSCEVTERRLYFKAVTERLTAEIKKGDIVQAGIVISNSEVGCGSLKIEPMIYRLVCENGMISADHAMKKYHVGKRVGGEDENNMEFFRNETRIADDKAFFMKVQDLTRAALTDVLFERIVNQMRESTEKKIDGDIQKVVEVFGDKNRLTGDETSSVLKHLINGGDLSQYGLLNAVTRMSQDECVGYDRATELERLGGDVLELSNNQWKVLNNAS